MNWIDENIKKPKKETLFWAIVKGFTSPLIMCYTEIDDSAYRGMSYARVYDIPYFDTHKKEWEADDIQWDDDYKITHWMPLPEPPKQ